MEQIAHLTLFTGHLRNTSRREVRSDTIALLRPYVMGAGGEIGDTGWTVKMIQGVAPGSCSFELHHSGLWLFSCYMAWTTTADKPMWDVVKQASKTAVSKPEHAPWLAVHAMPDFPLIMFKAPHAIFEAGELERCIAWTVIETFAGYSALPN